MNKLSSEYLHEHLKTDLSIEFFGNTKRSPMITVGMQSADNDQLYYDPEPVYYNAYFVSIHNVPYVVIRDDILHLEGSSKVDFNKTYHLNDYIDFKINSPIMYHSTSMNQISAMMNNHIDADINVQSGPPDMYLHLHDNLLRLVTSGRASYAAAAASHFISEICNLPADKVQIKYLSLKQALEEVMEILNTRYAVKLNSPYLYTMLVNMAQETFEVDNTKESLDTSKVDSAINIIIKIHEEIFNEFYSQISQETMMTCEESFNVELVIHPPVSCNDPAVYKLDDYIRDSLDSDTVFISWLKKEIQSVRVFSDTQMKHVRKCAYPVK